MKQSRFAPVPDSTSHCRSVAFRTRSRDGSRLSTRVESGISSASERAASVEIVGDLAARSTSEIIEEETPLLPASARTDKLNSSRRLRIVRAIRFKSLSSIEDKNPTPYLYSGQGFFVRNRVHTFAFVDKSWSSICGCQRLAKRRCESRACSRDFAGGTGDSL
ncbi:hypothetical protein BRAS3843_1090047 [Bradyrhizobium sp. STM 3843]|nr:hypothetical protein BRAS3843_1090047 [Bradyrhizobium sp. STM 3843]